MTHVRDIMNPGLDHLTVDSSVADAVAYMHDEDIGAVPVCSTDGRLQGMVTDRDVAMRLGESPFDPSTTNLSEVMTATEVITIGADDDVSELVDTMARHQVRRLPVVDGNEVIGVVSQADVAKNCEAGVVANMLAGISRP